MKKLLSATLIISAGLYLAAQPPPTLPRPVNQNYFDTTITDNYAWLENLSDSTVKKWYEDQSAYADNILRGTPGIARFQREYIQFNNRSQRMRVNFPSVVTRTNRYYILSRRTGDFPNHDIEYSVRYVNDPAEQKMFSQKSLDSSVNKRPSMVDLQVSPDESKISVTWFYDGKENDAFTKVYDIREQKFLPFSLKDVHGGGWNPRWLADSKTIFFMKPIKKDGVVEIFENWMLHDIHQPQEKDVSLFAPADTALLGKDDKGEAIPFYGIFSQRSTGYLILRGGREDEKQDFYYSMFPAYRESKSQWKKLAGRESAIMNLMIVSQSGKDYVYASSSLNAQNGKIIRALITPSGVRSFETIVPESNLLIQSFAITNDKLVITYRYGMKWELVSYSIAKDSKPGNKQTISLPVPGAPLLQPRFYNGNRLMVEMNQWANPAIQYELDLDRKTFIKPFGDAPFTAMDSLRLDLEIKEVDVTARDGVKIPLTIIHRKGMVLDGSNITGITGYGSYGISLNPRQLAVQSWLVTKKNMVLAIAHVRGGGEYGRHWSQAALKENKYRSWQDFIDCAEWLIKEGYTSKEKLIAHGGSMGGLLVSMAMIERPDLFRIVLAEVPAVHLAKTKNTQDPIVANFNSRSEYKTAIKNDAYFQLRDGVSYPIIILTAGWNDPRVEPWQPGKFAARLQSSNNPNNTVLLKTAFGGGHFAASGLTAPLEYYGYALWKCGHTDFF